MLDHPRQTFVVGDIHGRLGVLENALTEIERRATGGTVVFLGNYAQGGTEGRLVLDRLMRGAPIGWRWVCLMGSHENLLVSDWTSQRAIGPQAQLHWLARLPLVHEDQHRVYAHAALDDAFSVTNQPIEIVLHGIYDDADRRGYLNKHLVHGHRASTRITAGDRTALESFETSPDELLVACCDDGIVGPPVTTFAVDMSSMRPINAFAPRQVNYASRVEQEVRSLRDALAIELSQLERLRGDLALPTMLVESHQDAMASYRNRLSVLESEGRRTARI